MSSLGTTSKQLDGLNATLVESRGKLASFRDAEPVATHETKKSLELLKSSCTKLKAETLAALLATIDKLVAKIDYKDPVSGTARYGDSARTKILSFQETVSLLQIELDEQLVEVGELLAITNKCLPTHDKVEEAITAAQGVATNIRGVPIVGPIASIDRFVDFKVTEQPHVATVTDTAHELGDHHVSELEEKARLVRERKATEAEHALRVQRMIQDTLEEIILHFNGIRNLQLARIAEKDSSNQLSGPIAIILQSPSNVVKEALKTTLGILERIISRPDDVAARRVRITHPVLKEKLTGAVGGIELLLALGFQARLQAPDAAIAAEAKQPSPAQLSALEATLQEVRSCAFTDLSCASPSGCSDARYGTCIFPLLAPNTLWEVRLEMQEPFIDTLTSSASTEGTAVKLSWLDWFDSLNAYKVVVEEALKKLS